MSKCARRDPSDPICFHLSWLASYFLVVCQVPFVYFSSQSAIVHYIKGVLSRFFVDTYPYPYPLFACTCPSICLCRKEGKEREKEKEKLKVEKMPCMPMDKTRTHLYSFDGVCVYLFFK